MSDKFTTDFLDCVNRPFSYHADGRVPDGYAQNTVRLMDYFDSTPFSLPIASAVSVPTYGIAFMCFIGQNSLANSLVLTNVSGAASTSIPNKLYGYSYSLIGNSGQILQTAVAETEVHLIADEKYSEPEDKNVGVNTSPYLTYGTVNYNTILGVSDQNSYSTSGMVAGLRFNSMGMRIWPTIEVVTDSGALHVSKYYGCQMTPAQFARAQSAASNLYTVMKECPDFFETHNSDGISSRINLINEGPLKFYEVQSLNNLNDDGFSTNNCYFPVMVVQFSQLVDTSITELVALPFNFMYRTQIEAVMQTPTPLLGTRPPLSLNFLTVAKEFQYFSNRYPTVVSGHTFRPYKVSQRRTTEIVKYYNNPNGNKNKNKTKNKNKNNGTKNNNNNNNTNTNKKKITNNSNPKPVVIIQQSPTRGRGSNSMRNSNNNNISRESAMAARTDLNYYRPRGSRGRGRGYYRYRRY